MDIVEYESMHEIELYSWEKLLAPWSLKKETLLEMINQKKFIMIWDDIIAVSSIKKIWKRVKDEMESYILSFDKSTSLKMRKILKERDEKWLITNWPTHLAEISKKRWII